MTEPKNYTGMVLHNGRLYSCGGLVGNTDLYHIVEVGKPKTVTRNEFKLCHKLGAVKGEGTLYSTKDGQLFLREEGAGSEVIPMVLEEA